MTVFDIAIIAVALALGVWAAFWAVVLGKRIHEMGGPVAWYREMCFGVWYWQLRWDRAITYSPRHQPQLPGFMRHWDKL